MLEPPPIAPDRILAHLVEARGLSARALTFLPLGADVDTAVYRVSATDGRVFFVKLRRGPFRHASVAVPRHLAGLGIDAIIPPLPDRAGRLVSRLDAYSVIVYPYIEGRNAYEAPVTDAQRRELGAAVAGMHGAAFPPAVVVDAPRERYEPKWRNAVADLLALAERGPYPDEVAADMAAFMRERAGLIRTLVTRAAGLAGALVRRDLPFTLCHADLHAGNLHVTSDGRIYIVDWDTLICAPKERDLMFVGAGIDRVWAAQAGQAAFYEGYGPAEIDRQALAYYRCERAVEDIAAFGEQLLLSGEGGADRAQSLHYFKLAFEDGDAIPTALATPVEL